MANSDGKKKMKMLKKNIISIKNHLLGINKKDKIIIEQNIDLTEETVFSKAKEIFKLQLLQYGMKKEDVELENMTKNLIQNQEERRRIEEQIVTDEMIKYFKKNIKAKNKEVSIDEFSKLVTKKLVYMNNHNEFKKYATKHLGINSLTLDTYSSLYGNYISPTITEERKLNVATMDVFSRLMMDRIIFFRCSN